MTTSSSRRRSRYNTRIRIDLRLLRQALGLDADAAAKVLGEHPTLVVSQEEAGLDADKAYVVKARDLYVAHAVEVAASDTYPPMVSSGATSIYRLRRGLGLTSTDAGRILRLRSAVIEDLESFSRAFPARARQVSWAAYADWASRRLRREMRAANARPKMLLPTINKAAQRSPSEELARLQAMAYAPRMSAAEAEAEALRLLMR